MAQQQTARWSCIGTACIGTVCLGPSVFRSVAYAAPSLELSKFLKGCWLKTAIDGKLQRWRPISCGVAYNDLEWHQSPVSYRTCGSMLALADLLVSNHELILLRPSKSRRQGFCTKISRDKDGAQLFACLTLSTSVLSIL